MSCRLRRDARIEAALRKIRAPKRPMGGHYTAWDWVVIGLAGSIVTALYAWSVWLACIHNN